MDLEPELFFRLLSEYSQNKKENPTECARLLSTLNNTLIREQQNSAYLDLYLVSMFNRSNGFLQFITNVANKKQFKSSIVKVFEIIYTFINNFKYKLEKYIIQINNMVLKVLKSGVTSVAEKTKALEVLIIGFNKVNLSLEYKDHYREVCDILQYTLSMGIADTVKAKVLIAIGTFVKQFPYVVKNQENLKALFLNQLEAQYIQRTQSLYVIEGVFTGLTLFCESFPFQPTQDQIRIGSLYKQIENVLFSARKVKSNKACLTFLSKNIYLFGDHFMKEYKKWHDFLLNQMNESPDDEMIVSLVGSFYEATANHIAREENTQLYKDVTMYFFNHFKEVVQSSDQPTTIQKKLSFQGLHHFAKAFYKHIDAKIMAEFFVNIMQSFEQTYILEQTQEESNTADVSLKYLPEYTQAVCSLMQFKNITHNEFVCLKRGIICMIRVFPKLHYTQHSLVVRAFVETLFFVHKTDEKLLDSFIEYFVYQGVIWSCSHQPLYELALMSDTSNDSTITVKSYMTFWKKMLKIAQLPEFDKLGCSLTFRQSLVKKIIKRLITTLLVILTKLNVNLVQHAENDQQFLTDIQSNFQVAKIDDFIIFFNVVDFYREILLDIDPQMVKNCICKLVNYLILKCTTHPYISGFYKLLSIWLQISNKLEHFSTAKTNSLEDIRVCSESLTNFLTLLLCRIKQFKDELLISCLELLLSYPTSILQNMLPSCVSAFTTVFYVGRTCIHLAQMGVNTLERLQNDLPGENLEQFLAPIIPSLDLYLQSVSVNNLKQSSSRRKVPQPLKKRRIILEVEPELDKLQRKILDFVGQQNVELCKAFVGGSGNADDDNSIESVVTWDRKQRLKVTLPYEDCKLDLYLDDLVPRVIHLALYSSNEKIRLTACELLHATVLLFLGTAKPMTHSGLTDLSELLKEMSFPLLQLSCDLNPTVKQLFQPLVIQMIHWYTHTKQMGSAHCAIFLEALMDGITHPTDSAVRDFSCKCVNEFVKWSLKQTDQSDSTENNIIIKSLLKKMQFFSTHPDPFKKMGAALIFNNIYQEILEDTGLLNLFWLEFLHLFVKSLALIDSQTEDDSVKVQILQALTYIEKGLMLKNNLFNEHDKTRRVPCDFRGELLTDAVIWILAQTNSRSLCCRSKCMQMFCHLVPYTRSFENMQTFVGENFANAASWVSEIYDKFLTEFPTIESLANPDASSVLLWLQCFLRAIDGCFFTINNNLIVNATLPSPILVESIQYFLEKLLATSIEQALIVAQSKTCNTTVLEKKDYQELKCLAIIKLIELFDSLATHEQGFMEFYGSNLWILIRDLLFNPELVGFNRLEKPEDCDKIEEILYYFLQKLPTDQVSSLNSVIMDYVGSNNFIDIDLESNVSLKLRNIVNGLQRLQVFSIGDLNISQFSVGRTVELLNKFIKNGKNLGALSEHLQDTTLRHCLSILDFTLESTDEFETFVNCLYLPYSPENSDNNKHSCFGTYILSQFEDTAVRRILENFQLYLTLASKQSQFMDETLDHLFFILNKMSIHKELRFFNEFVVKTIIQFWQDLANFFNKSFANVELGLDFVNLIYPICDLYGIDFTPLKLWLYDLLSSNKVICTEEAKTNFCIDVFNLLSSMVDCEDDREEDLRSGLVHLQTYFSSLTTFEKKEHMLIKLWLNLPKTHSLEMFKFLVNIYVTVSDDVIHFDIQDTLNSYVINTSDSLQLKSMSEIYEICSSADILPLKKYKLLTTTLPLFQNCSLSVFEQFFLEHVGKMWEVLQQETRESNLFEKTMHCMLFELLFFRIQILPSDTDTSSVVLATSTSQNKEFIIKLFQFTLNAFTDTKIQSNFLRIYRCHVYNCMVSIVTNSIKNPAYYPKLFSRDQNNEDILWKSLIDSQQAYSFGMDFDAIPKRTKMLVNIRDNIRQEKIERNQFTQAKKYVETMRVYNSSLCEDSTAYDFTNVTLRRRRITEDCSEMTAKQNFAHYEVEIDLVDVNKHECMSTVCGLIRYIAEKEETEESMLPAWLKGIRRLLLSDNTHKNIKIFWMKVIDNTVDVFKKYAKWFLEPLLKFLVDKCAGETINYFVADVISVLASWANIVLPSTETEIKLTTQLLIFLIDQIDNERRDIFKYHLELLRLIVEAWKSCIQVPHEILYSKINVDHTSPRLQIGIHLSSIFLANNLKLWPAENYTDFPKKIFDIITRSHLKTCYKPAAEILGLLLKVSQNEAYSTKLLNNVNVLFKRFSDLDKHALCLEAIALNFPDIVTDLHLRKLLGQINLVPQPLKKTYLRIFLKKPEIFERIDDFKQERWENLLQSDDNELQILTAEFLYCCFEILKKSECFLSVIETLCKMVSIADVVCRSRTFDIIMLVLQSQRELKRDPGFSRAYELCKSALVQGLVDSDEEIKKKVYDFWEQSSILPAEARKRFSNILSDLYKPSTENDFLSYSCYFLLSSLKHSQEYNKALFEYPLEDCNFEDYDILSNSRTVQQSVVPLFAETLFNSSQNNFQNISDKSYRSNTSRETQQSFSQSEQMRYNIISTQSNLFVKPDEDMQKFDESGTFKIPQGTQPIKRRFLKQKNVSKSEEVRKWLVRKERQREEAFRNQNKILLKVKYRKGDFPDVQIPLASLCDTLQALLQSDYEISQILFLKMFSIITQMTDTDTAFMNTLWLAVKTILTNSTQFNTALFKTIFDMILMKKQFEIFEPDLILNVRQNSPSGESRFENGILQKTPPISFFLDYIEIYVRAVSVPKDFIQKYNETCIRRLYKEMEEWDVIKAIFVEKVDCNENVQAALLAESRKQWRIAQENYKQLLEFCDSTEKKDFYCESYFKCFAHLGEWESLSETIESFVTSSGSQANPWTQLWEQGWNRKKLLPWYIVAKTKEVLVGSSDSQQFFVQLNEILDSPDDSEYLKNNFSEELCILWVVKGEIEEAKQNLVVSVNSFLNKWRTLNPIYLNMRYNSLLKVRNFIDIKKFINVFENLTMESEDDIKKLLNYWNRSAEEQLPSILLNETRVLYRQQYVKQLMKQLKSIDEDGFEDIFAQDLQKMQNQLSRELVNVSIIQNNYFMARRYFKKCHIKDDLGLKLSFAKLACLKADLLSDPAQKIYNIIQSQKILVPLLDPAQDVKLSFQSHLQQFSNFETIVSLSQNNTISFEVYTKLQPLLDDISDELPIDIASYAARKLHVFLERNEDNLLASMLSAENFNEQKILSEAYLKLAYFTQNQRPMVLKQFIYYVLRGMRWGSSEATQLFPCIFMGSQLNQEEKSVFLEEVTNVPIWMFLGWIPQLLLQIDTPNVSVVSSILIKISETYPQAILYEFCLSKEMYSYKESSFVIESLQLIERLDKILLRDREIEKFFKALSFVALPAMILDYYITKLIKACKNRDMEKFRNLHQHVLNEIFGSESNSGDSQSVQGNMFEDLYKKCKSEVRNILDQSPEDQLNSLGSIKEILKTLKTSKKSVLLKDYSPWLASFLPHKMNLDLEIPGQYTGDKIPLVQHHIKIFSFHPNVKVLSSKTLPIKVTILGHDTKEYPFLIKFGEDLRQDQRIEQLFVLMNGIFKHDPEIQRNFSVVTYKVIPLKTNLGLIEWIADTTLDSFLSKLLPNQEMKQLSYEKYCEMVYQFRKVLPVDAYGYGAMNYPRDKVIACYRNVVSMIPHDILRRGLWQLGSTAENFFVLRNNFITSYAVMCLTNWILGIGDRHLSNILICTKTGKAIGIDFGFAFGTATQLPVPESVPFRLTPHIVSVMEPLGEKGLFKDVMIHALRCLRNNKDSLLATMKAFVDDPSVDWLEYASRIQETNRETNKLELYPMKKIDQAKRKLEGANSVAIMIEDLESNSDLKKDYFEAYKSLIRGVAQFDVRARKSNYDLSVEDQVDCLIDHATDYNLLGRMYDGWSSWV